MNVKLKMTYFGVSHFMFALPFLTNDFQVDGKKTSNGNAIKKNPIKIANAKLVFVFVLIISA